MDRNIFTDKVKGALIKFPPHAYFFLFYLYCLFKSNNRQCGRNETKLWESIFALYCCGEIQRGGSSISCTIESSSSLMSFLLPSLYSVLSCIDCPTSFVFSPSVILLLLLSSHNLILMFHEAHLMSQPPRSHWETCYSNAFSLDHAIFQSSWCQTEAEWWYSAKSLV